jgi:ubiquinone/menaquinone biosynthesis C-methylase UbiE
MKSFDRVARIYQLLERAAFGRALERARFRYLDRLADCREILIVGEGDGRVLERLLSIAPHASVRCIDSSAAMLDLARRRLETTARMRVQFECADARAADVDPMACDAVVTMFLLDCFSAQEVVRLVDRLGRGLRPNGLWLFADFSIPAAGWHRVRAKLLVRFLYAFFRWQTGLAVRELPPSEDILRDAGFHVLESTTLRGGLLRTAVYSRTRRRA